MISPNHHVDRSRVNDSAVQAAKVPLSGFNKSYKTYSTFNLGRLHVSGYHHLMPNESFRGSNQASLTFFRLNQPNVSDVNISQHNFYVPYRIIDNTFEEAVVPTTQNSMSSSWAAPSFSISQIVKSFIVSFSAQFTTDIETDFFPDLVGHPTSNISSISLSHLQASISDTDFLSFLSNDFSHHYLEDWLTDVYLPRAKYILGTINLNTTNIEAFRIFIDALFFPFIGEGSLLDELGYIYVRRSDLLHITAFAGAYFSEISNIFNDVLQNEYAIRAYYAVWYEYYRDNNLEPKTSNLTNYKKIGSTTVVLSSPSFLVNRFRSWGKDVFTTSMPDDIMRHVFAPVNSNSSFTIATVSSKSTDYTFAETTPSTADLAHQSQQMRNIVSVNLSYQDPVTGLPSTIACPLPARVNDVLTAASSTNITSSYLDLFTLRNAQSLERYLKRNFYFGDEYQDRMLAHYGSYVSDFRVNRPEFLSSSLSPINPNQVVSSAGTDVAPQGERNMTITASTQLDTFNFRAEEFGIVLNIISIMPVAQYAGVCPQNMLSKSIDYPLPEFAANNEEFSRVYEIAFSGLAADQERIKPTFGHHPYAHSWRSRINEVHKEYLSDLQELTFRRLFGMDDDNLVPKLNYQFIHCKPNLGMFAAGHDRLYTPQVYGVVNHQFYTETPLPTPVEII